MIDEVVPVAEEITVVETEPEVESQELDNPPLDDSLSSELFPDVTNHVTTPSDSHAEAASQESINDESNISEAAEQDSLESPVESVIVHTDSQETVPELSQDLKELVDNSEGAEPSRETVLVVGVEEEKAAVAIGEDAGLLVDEVVSQVEEAAGDTESIQAEEILAPSDVEVEEAVAAVAVIEVGELEEDVSLSESSVQESASAEVSETEIEEDDTESAVESADVSLVVSEVELEVEVVIAIESQIVVIEEEIEMSLVETEDVSDGDDSGEEFDEEESELEADRSISVENDGAVEVKAAQIELRETMVEESTVIDVAVIEESQEVLVELEMVVVATVIEETGAFWFIFLSSASLTSCINNRRREYFHTRRERDWSFSGGTS